MLRWYKGYGYYEDFLREHMPEIKLGEYTAVKEAKNHRDTYQEKLNRARAGEDEFFNQDLYEQEVFKADRVLDKLHWEYEKSCNRAGKDHLEKEDYIAAVLLTE